MIIAGGSYVERCEFPRWRRLFGSGLRAALALQKLSPASELHTYAPEAYAADVAATLAGAGLKGHIHPAVQEMQFEWLHPFLLVEYPDPDMKLLAAMEMAAPAILRFGMIEGTAKVQAQKAVYSVQNEAEGFFHNGSTAKELVMVASERELQRMLPDLNTSNDRVRELFESDGYRELDRFAILLRNEVGDVSLRQRGGTSVDVPTYAAESYFKIGAGDVLAAAFAHAWLEDGLELDVAADKAARSLAWFVQDARLPLPEAGALPTLRASGAIRGVRILGSETLEMGALLIAAADWFERQGITVSVELAEDGLKGGDGPTLVLVGARASSWDIVALGDRSASASQVVVFNNGAIDLQAYFPGAQIFGDYASALYHLLRSDPA